MSARRVVITGMGAVTSLGLDAPSTWRALTEGRCGIGPVEHLPVEQLRTRFIAAVRDFDPLAHFDEKRLAMMDRVSQFAVVAAREAVAQAGMPLGDGALAERSAVVLGTGIGGNTTLDEQMKKFYGEGSPRVHPFSIVRIMPNAPACQIGIDLGITGPAFVVSSACASANHAIAVAYSMVRGGAVDAAICGGTEACLSLGTVKAWEAMRILSDDWCRPFCRERRGLVLGEGAAVFVIEPLDAARARGATILAELAGAGMSADANDMIVPSEHGAARAIQAALDDARLAPDAVGYVNAHGTGTPANDPTETRALKRVFGAHAPNLAVSSTKSMHGHALGAAGALELIATIGALRDGVIPPTINFGSADPECDLDYVPNTAREKRIDAAISSSFAFGGLNAVLALRRAA